MPSDKIDPSKKPANGKSVRDNAMEIMRETRAKIDPELLRKMRKIIGEQQQAQQPTTQSPISGQDMIPVDKQHMQDIVKQYLELVPGKGGKA